MACINVHGSPISTATQRALAAIHEKGLDFKLIPVNLGAGEHKREPFLSLNPFGQVPAVEIGDLKLFESRAITQHIAHTNREGTELLCPMKDMPILSVWMEVEAQQFDPACSKLALELHYKPMFGMTTDPAVVEENEAKLAKVLDVYEKRLAQQKFLASDCFTLADLHHLPNLHLLMESPSKKVVEDRPHVAAWAATILGRPAWQKTIAMTKS